MHYAILLLKNRTFKGLKYLKCIVQNVYHSSYCYNCQQTSITVLKIITKWYAFFVNLLIILLFCILSLPVHIYIITRHRCIFLCWIPPQKMADKGRNMYKVDLTLYISICHCSAVAGIHMAIHRLITWVLRTLNLKAWVRECKRLLEFYDQYVSHSIIRIGK
jgi:hypothetical protein